MHPRGDHRTRDLRLERTGGDRMASGIATAMRPKCNRAADGLSTIEQMAIKKLEHVGIVVEDLEAAIEFFAELGLEPAGKRHVEGSWVDRIIGLDGTKAEPAGVGGAHGSGRK